MRNNSDNINPTITVITPTYNRASLLAETIKSVLDQGFRDFEYYIIDDGSTDNTKEIIKPFLIDKRVKYIYKKNSGEADSTNLGWNLAKGQYFTQVNSDDPILPGLFSRMVNVFAENKNAVVAYPDFYFINDNGKIIKADSTPDWNFLNALKTFSCYAASAGTFIRKTAFKDWDKIKDKRYKYINDVHMYWRMALRGEFIHVPAFLATWRQHDGGISNQRYKSISELEMWFKEYFGQDLPKEVIACKNIVRNSINKYIVELLSQAEDFDGKKTILDKYKKKAGIQVFRYSNLQVGDNDLIGNKFNGHDLHIHLRNINVDSSHIVWNKESDDANTFVLSANRHNRLEIKAQVEQIQNQFSLNSLLNPFFYDLLFSKQFVETDSVHFHLLHNGLIDLNLLPIITRIKPIVWTLHDPWILGGHCVHHFNCKKWMKTCYDCPLLSTHFNLNSDTSTLNFIIKRNAILNSKFDVIVASKWMYKKAKSSPILAGKKIHIVPFGVNKQIFKPANKIDAKKKLGIDPNATTIMFRCDYSEYKGMEYVEYVIRKLSNRKDIVLLTTAQAPRFKTPLKIYEYGWVKNDEKLASIYQAADIFLAPSKVDAFGMMVVEAMMCETLPIVIDGTALRETIGAPDYGICTKASMPDYYNSVKYYIQNKNETLTRAKKSCVYARTEYDLDKYVRKIDKINQSVIKNFERDEEASLLLSQIIKHVSSKQQVHKDINIVSGMSSHRAIFLLTFYKIDKIIPKNIRKKIKLLLFKNEKIRKLLEHYG